MGIRRGTEAWEGFACGGFAIFPRAEKWVDLQKNICYIFNRTDITKDGVSMIVEIDFNSEEALYIQLRNRIILGIATSELKEGDTLPSVRQLAEDIGINMHTVNKAYTVLKQEGFVRVDRRRGAVVAINADRIRDIDQVRQELKVILAKASCKNISRQEVHALIDEIFEEYGGI